MQDLKVSMIQSPLYWHDIDANLAMFEEKIWDIEDQPDLIVLPEMFTTGFTNATNEMAEVMNLKSCKWMNQIAQQTGSDVTGSIIIKEGKLFYNRLIWMKSSGELFTYDKKHLFSLADEHQYFESGRERIIVDIKGWKICPLICYDLRFPVWSRNNWQKHQRHEYDVLLYVANWPMKRIYAWDTLLKARAIENLSYVIGVNRIGTDDRGFEYNGHSAVYNALGHPVFEAGESALISTVQLPYDNLESTRNTIPFFHDADKFTIDDSDY